MTGTKKIAFQGVLGAYSHLAISELFDDFDPIANVSFDQALACVSSNVADLAVIPIENSTFGRVADIHMLLPKSDLYVIEESFLKIRHMLLAKPGTKLSDIKKVISHPQALGQCRERLKSMGLEAQAHSDTAGAAQEVSQLDDPSVAALASSLAATTYGLEILQEDMQDEDNNTTRFVVLSRQSADLSHLQSPLMTCLTFEVRNVPAALFKALGGFATNGVNMTKLESYYDSDSFSASEFYAEIEGKPGDADVDLALEELAFFSKHIKILGTFTQARPRTQL